MLPPGAPTVASSTWEPEEARLTISVTLDAEPGSTVQALIDGSEATSSTADEDGVALLVLQPSWQQLWWGTVDFRYVAGDATGPATTVRLWDLWRVTPA